MYHTYHNSNAILFDVIVVYSNDFALKSAQDGRRDVYCYNVL